MDFQAQDSSNVKSLLAFLRTTQEKAQAEGSSAASVAATAIPTPTPVATELAATAIPTPTPVATELAGPASVPPAKSLTELLASLQKRPQTSDTPPTQAHAASLVTPVDGASIAAALLQQHAEPLEPPKPSYEPFKAFGPIASQSAVAPRRAVEAGPSLPSVAAQSFNSIQRQLSNDNTAAVASPRATPAPVPPSARAPAPVSNSSSLVERARAAAAQTPLASALKKRALEEDTANQSGKLSTSAKGKSRATREEMRSWSFAKALPVLSGLLEDESFVSQVKAMKAEQDALERKLFAQQEKLTSVHVQKGNNERTMASLARKPWTEAQEKKHKAELEAKVIPFHKLQAVPALDALAARHHAKLEELGVPGLGRPLAGSGGWQAVGAGTGTGATDAETRARVRKLMAVLEGVLADEG